MEYYASYRFRRSDDTVSNYFLKEKKGVDISGMKLAKDRKNCCEYMKISVPRNPAIRRYFAYTLELSGGAVLSSVEGFGIDRKTFGDAKSIGENAVILLQFSNDMRDLAVYFVRSLLCSKEEKKNVFSRWRNGEELIPEQL